MLNDDKVAVVIKHVNIPALASFNLFQYFCNLIKTFISGMSGVTYFYGIWKKNSCENH